MGTGNQNFYVTEKFISQGTLKEETFAISQILALSTKVYSAKFLIRCHQRKFIPQKCWKIINMQNFQHFCWLSHY